MPWFLAPFLFFSSFMGVCHLCAWGGKRGYKITCSGNYFLEVGIWLQGFFYIFWAYHGTWSVDQAAIKLTKISFPASHVLGLNACTTAAQPRVGILGGLKQGTGWTQVFWKSSQHSELLTPEPHLQSLTTFLCRKRLWRPLFKSLRPLKSWAGKNKTCFKSV